MQNIYAKLTERIKRTNTVESFRFEQDQPGNDSRFDFLPGQFCRVMFDEVVKNNTELNKYLSFSSAPGKKYFEITKRLSESEFSQKLKELRPGSRVNFQMPMGNCVYKDEYSQIAFLIGGIGITPAISIIEYLVEKKLNTKVTLLYANRSEDEIAFRPELDDWQKTNPNIEVCYTVSQKSCAESVCREGAIDVIFCRESIEDLHNRKIFVYGPPAMVDAMKLLSKQLGCRKEHLLTENFIGY